MLIALLPVLLLQSDLESAHVVELFSIFVLAMNQVCDLRSHFISFLVTHVKIILLGCSKLEFEQLLSGRSPHQT